MVFAVRESQAHDPAPPGEFGILGIFRHTRYIRLPLHTASVPIAVPCSSARGIRLLCRSKSEFCPRNPCSRSTNGAKPFFAGLC